MTTQIGSASSFADFMDVLDAFLADQGHAWGLVATADGNGQLESLSGAAASVHESITVSMLNALDYTVQGSVSGNLGYGVVGTPFTSGKANFTVNSGSQSFIAGDHWTFSTSPAWTLLRRALLTDMTTDSGTTGATSFHCLNDGILDSSGFSDQWETTGGPPLEFIVELETAISAVEYAFVTTTDTNAPTAWTVDRWDGAAWVALDTRTGITWAPSDIGNWRVFTISSPVSAARYRWRITARIGDRTSIRQFALRTVAGGLNRIEEVIAWQAPGDDDSRGFYCAVKPLYRADRDYYTLELLAMSAWSATAELVAQAGLHRNAYLPLWDAAMDYWLVARGSGVRGVIKIGTQYESFSIGFIDPYFPPNEYPLPLMLGGSLVRPLSNEDYRGKIDSENLRYSIATRAHSAWPMAALPAGITASSSTQRNQERGACRLRLIDGTWRAMVCNADGDFATTGLWGSQLGFGSILPYYRGFQSTARSLADAPILWPVIVGTDQDVYGELPGIRAVSGDGISAETIITEAGVDWLVVPNISRVDFEDFYALRLD